MPNYAHLSDITFGILAAEKTEWQKELEEMKETVSRDHKYMEEEMKVYHCRNMTAPFGSGQRAGK